MDINITKQSDVFIKASQRSASLVESARPKKSYNIEQLAIPLRSVVIFLGATIVSAVAFELLPLTGGGIFNLLQLKCTFSSNSNKVNVRNVSSYFVNPQFAVFGKSGTEKHLHHVIKILELFGYKRTSFNDDWDLLWAHDYPFLKIPQRMKNLESHQRVNHVPGCGFITNKVDLSTTQNLSFLPKAFKMPLQQEAFQLYAREHKDALFVEKNNEHRKIVIKSPKEINLNASDFFVQEYIKNPLLVDGYKFDIGVYVVITSVDPLRIYMYGGDVLFRYCYQKYHPFDPKQVDKYVVGDDYLPTWEVPSLGTYFRKYGGSMRGAFDVYLQDHSLDPTLIWLKVEDIVRRTVLSKEENISRLLRSYKTKNFFDLMRFDMIIDDQMQVYLMEVNMSPNLSSAHFKENSLLYEQVLYSVFNLVGIGSPVRKHVMTKGNKEDSSTTMITAEKNLATDLRTCAYYDCDKNCNNDKCQLCLSCVSGSNYNVLREAHREHLHKTNMKRVFPKPIHNPESFDIESEVQNLSIKNAWLTRWFFEKCLYDRSWCI